MDVLNDRLEVSLQRRDESGTKLEPEQVPAQRVLETTAPMNRADNGEALGLTIPTKIVVQGTTESFATQVRSLCQNCVYFDRPAWHGYFRKLSSTADGVRLLNNWRAFLLANEQAEIMEAHTGTDDDPDVEHALMSMGICQAMTESCGDPTILSPDATCPSHFTDEMGSRDLAKPFPFSFKPRNRMNERKSVARFDAMMRMAMAK